MKKISKSEIRKYKVKKFECIEIKQNKQHFIEKKSEITYSERKEKEEERERERTKEIESLDLSLSDSDDEIKKEERERERERELPPTPPIDPFIQMEEDRKRWDAMFFPEMAQKTPSKEDN